MVSFEEALFGTKDKATIMCDAAGSGIIGTTTTMFLHKLKPPHRGAKHSTHSSRKTNDNSWLRRNCYNTGRLLETGQAHLKNFNTSEGSVSKSSVADRL